MLAAWIKLISTLPLPFYLADSKLGSSEVIGEKFLITCGSLAGVCTTVTGSAAKGFTTAGFQIAFDRRGS